MVATYILDEHELNENFIQLLKNQFRNKKIQLTVAEAIDETDYLLSNPNNAKHLLTAIDNSRTKGNLINTSIEELQSKIG